MPLATVKKQSNRTRVEPTRKTPVRILSAAKAAGNMPLAEWREDD